jgi:hypothetical protein
LDSRSAGFLANLHPVHHDREQIQHDVAKFLNDSMSDDADKSEMPDVKVVASSANESNSNKRVSSRFLAITCPNGEEALRLRKKLVAAYSTLPNPIDQSLGTFIPANAKYTDKEIFRFRKLIQRQNQYLACHRNILMDGIDDKLLRAYTSPGTTLLDDILVGAQIGRVDTVTTKDYIGRYNFSTTAEHYIAAVEWLDTTLPILIETLPQDQRGDFDGCVERVSPRVISSSSSTAASRTSTTSYLSALTAGFGSDQSADKAPPRQRRKSRYAPKIEFDFDADLEFPDLPTTTHPARACPPQQSPA